MTLADRLLEQVEAAGGTIEARGDKLRLKAARALPGTLLDDLRCHKAEVLALLAGAGPTMDTTAAWRKWVRERTMARWAGYGANAHRMAFEEAVSAWHLRHAKPYPSRCTGCGKPTEGRPSLSLADGARVHFADLGCLIGYGRRWRQEAVEAMADMGIKRPGVFKKST